MTPLMVTVELAGPVADYLPALDALLMRASADRGAGQPPRRDMACPAPLDSPPMPLMRETIGGWPVFRVSAPVLSLGATETAYFGKRIGVERASLLAPGERKVVVTSNTWTKSYRLPVKLLTPDRVVWFAVGDTSGVRDLLGDVTHVGRVLRHGWGRVKSWLVEECGQDRSWFAPTEDGRPVLMRVLPKCDALPEDLDGFRPDFGACCPPYWHRDRYTEVVTPC